MRSTWRDFFDRLHAPAEYLLITFDAISQDRPGWSLTEIKQLSVRERDYWTDVALQRRKRRFGG